MKKKLLPLVLIGLAVLCVCAAFFFRDYAVPLHSDVRITSPSETQTDSLYRLCKIWGYMKYRHPDIVSGKTDWDQELLDIMPEVLNADTSSEAEQVLYGSASDGPENSFGRALYETETRQYNSALGYYDRAVESSGDTGLEKYYKAFYYMNRAVLRARMIEFISSIESNVQILSMDDSGNTRARVRDQITHQYDYSEAIADMKSAVETVPDMPYFHFNLGNLYCLSAEHISSIESFTRAIELYPYMGDAYFNRGLVLIYLKDREKGCIDLSRAGELGVQEAYSVINKYCEEEN